MADLKPFVAIIAILLLLLQAFGVGWSRCAPGWLGLALWCALERF